MNGRQSTADYFRFCPGEEQIHISNAICRGRRVAHYPKCPGCRFNDDEKSAVGEESNSAADLVGFLAQPNEYLGPVPEALAPEAAWRIGHAAAQYLHGRLRGLDRADPKIRSLVVGRDVRSASLDHQCALIRGVHSTGIDVIDVGAIDTPQLYFAVSHFGACGGVQISAGRHRPGFTGFNVCAAKGLPIGAETGLASIRDIAVRVPRHQTGMSGARRDVDLSEPYRDFVRSALPPAERLARPTKVVVDAQHGAAGRWLPIIFDRVRGLSIVPLNYQGDDESRRPSDPFTPQTLSPLRKAVKDHKADFAVAFDADADACAFVDEKSMTVPPDLIATLLGRRLIEREPGAVVVFDLRFGLAAAEEVQRSGGIHIRERIGQTHIRKTMAERHAIFGADLSGRQYFRDAFFCENALLAFAHILSLLSETGRKLGELVRPLGRYRSSGQMRLACPDPTNALANVVSAHPNAQIDRLDGLAVRYPDWWFHVREAGAPDHLNLLLEARTKKLVDHHLAELAYTLKAKAEISSAEPC